MPKQNDANRSITSADLELFATKWGISIEPQRYEDLEDQIKFAYGRFWFAGMHGQSQYVKVCKVTRALHKLEKHAEQVLTELDLLDAESLSIITDSFLGLSELARGIHEDIPEAAMEQSLILEEIAVGKGALSLMLPLTAPYVDLALLIDPEGMEHRLDSSPYFKAFDSCIATAHREAITKLLTPFYLAVRRLREQHTKPSLRGLDKSRQSEHTFFGDLFDLFDRDFATVSVVESGFIQDDDGHESLDTYNETKADFVYQICSIFGVQSPEIGDKNKSTAGDHGLLRAARAHTSAKPTLLNRLSGDK